MKTAKKRPEELSSPGRVLFIEPLQIEERVLAQIPGGLAQRSPQSRLCGAPLKSDTLRSGFTALPARTPALAGAGATRPEEPRSPGGCFR